MKELKIAMVQMRCEKGTTSENVNQIISYLDEAAANGTEIACFPEMCISGYVDPTKCPSGILSWGDPEISRIVNWSKGKQITVIVGIVENNPDGKPFISQGVIRDGIMPSLFVQMTALFPAQSTR